MKLTATHLSGRRYMVRPRGAFGVRGTIAYYRWQAAYVMADNKEHACQLVNASDRNVQWQLDDDQLLMGSTIGA